MREASGALAQHGSDCVEALSTSSVCEWTSSLRDQTDASLKELYYSLQAEEIYDRLQSSSSGSGRSSSSSSSSARHSREGKVPDAIKEGYLARGMNPKRFAKHTDEYFQFRSDDPREKVLYLSAAHIQDVKPDGKNGLDAFEPELVRTILTRLDETFDLKFKVIRSYEEICKEVKEASLFGTLAYVTIVGHGEDTGESITLDRRASCRERV